MSSSTLDSTTGLGETRREDERRTDASHSVDENGPTATDPDATVVDPSRYRRLRGVSLVALLGGTAVLYLVGLSASGWGNSFYAAAAQAGSQSWKAFFYGSLDASNAITVDKPPASLWLMALSVRLFGLNAWSILAPQALLGVATVGVLYTTVRRSVGRGLTGHSLNGHWAGIAAGTMLALTPVAALMFRFDNPDALLLLLLTAATAVTLCATERGSGRWLALAGALVGFAFLTKTLQAFLILPALIAVYLIAAPISFRRRLLHLLGAFAAMIASLGWWVAIVELVPASMRPYVGGSANNSELELIFGYNRFARLFGNENGGVSGAIGGALGTTTQGAGGPGGGTGASMWGQTGLTRLFTGVSGGMIAWLIPAALVLAVITVVLRGSAPRTDRTRTAVLIWAGSMVLTAATFSFMAGIYHDYYTVALAPSIAATVAIGAATLWAERHSRLARAGLAAASAITAVWAFGLLSEATGHPYSTLKWVALVAGLLGALGLLFASRLPKLMASMVLGIALIGGVTGPAAYAIQTAATPHQGSIVTAGPVSGRTGAGAGGFGGARQRRDGRTGGPGQTGAQAGAQAGGQPSGAQRGGSGGSSVDGAMISLLRSDSTYAWAAATTGAQTAAGYQLAGGLPVMAIGGFNGGDPSPTLAQFQSLVAQHKIHYYIEGGSGRGGGGGGGGSRTSSQISSWVSANFTAKTVGGTTVYDLTASP